MRDGFISRLDQTGAYQWSGKLGGSSSETVNAVAIDAAGNYYVTGSFGGTADFNPSGGVSNTATSAGANDIFVAKYSPSGAYQWVKRAGGSVNDVGYGIKVSADGTVYVVGYYTETVDFDPGSGTHNLPGTGNFQNVFIWKLRSDGSFVDAEAIAGPSNEQAYALEMRGSEVLVVGQFFGTVDFDPGAGTSNLVSAGGDDAFVVYMDTLDLSYNAAMHAGGTGNDSYQAISVDALGHVWLLGNFSGTADLDPTANIDNHTSAGSTDIVFSRVRANGTYAYTKTFGGTGLDEGKGIVAHPNGNAYALGKYSNTVDWDPGVGTLNNTAAGSTDIFVIALDSTGSYVGHNCFGATQADFGVGIAVSATGTLALTGNFGDLVDFGVGSSFPLTTHGSDDAFVMIAIPYQCVSPDLPNPQALSSNLCIGSSTKAYVANLPSLGGAAQWQWYTGSCGGTAIGQGDTLPLTPTATETYFVRGEGGCISNPGLCGQVTVNVSTTQPNVAVTLNGNTLSATQSGATYQWIDCNNGNQPISGATSQSFTPSVSGSYACSLGMGVCLDTSICTTVTITDINPGAIPGLRLYPNPVQDRLVIDASQVSDIDRIEVYNLVGQWVAQVQLSTAVQHLDMSSLPAGVYTVKVFAAELVQGIKIVKQ